MKKEIPPAAIWGAVVLGVLVMVGIFFAAGGTGAPTAQDKQEWEEQAEVSRSRNQAYATGNSAPGAPASQPGQGTGEFEARQNASGN